MKWFEAAGLRFGQGLPKICVPLTESRLSALLEEAAFVRALPADLYEAVKEMEKDALVCQVLGSHISERYAKAKKAEWRAYREQVTEWEISNYLYKI